MKVETIKIKSQVIVWKNGKPVFLGKNLIVDAGVALIAQCLASSAGPTRPSHMAIGDSSTASTATMTALLGTEHQRVALTSTTHVSSSVTYVASFTGAVGTVSINEFGIFNDPAAGTMQARFTTPTLSFAVGDTLAVSWEVRFEGD